MRAEEFFERVRSKGKFESQADARAVTHATLETLGERVSEGEMADLATDLPREFAEVATARSHKRPPDFGVEEFIPRTADREFRRARTQLPDGYDALSEAEAE